MPLRLVDDDLGISMDIALSWDNREALAIQIERCLSLGPNSPFGWRLVKCLIQLIDSDLQRPTPSQLSYATSIAKALSIPMPPEVLRYRGSMRQFLLCYSGFLKEARERATLRSAPEGSMPGEDEAGE